MRNAAIGPQPDSRKSNAPAFGFGAADRNASSKVYVSKEHSKVDFGKLGPGAVYETKSSFGKQVDAKKRSPASVGFGSADRFLQPSAARDNRNPQVPGPGSYPLPKAVGKQTQSKAVTEGSFGFGTSTRDHAEKVFIGKEQAKVFFGMESPGPAAYKVSSGVGKQPESRNTTEPGFTIPRGGRGKDVDMERARKLPGAGQYRTVDGVGAQPRSENRTAPKYGFGTSSRDGANKVFLGKEQAKVFLGLESPGPASLGPKAFGGTGKQLLSTRASAPKATFGTGVRGSYDVNANPGPGAYA